MSSAKIDFIAEEYKKIEYGISTCDKNEKEYKDLYELRTIPVIIQNEFYRASGINKREEMPKELNNYSTVFP